MPNPLHRHTADSSPPLLRLAALLVMLVTACAGPGDVPWPAQRATGTEKPYSVNGVRYVPRADPGYDEIGTASWYGGRFHGRRTASGQRYDMNAMTAAHKTLPMGTRVRVTRLADRRSVILTINDRGPFAGKRIIDVSRRAAQELGFLGAGVAKVRVQALSGAPPDSRIQAAQARSEAPGAGAEADADAAHYLPVLTRAMEHGTRASAFYWTSRDSGRQGSIVPLTEPHEASRPFCRNYRRTAGDGVEQAVYLGRACREDDNSWRIVRERETAS